MKHQVKNGLALAGIAIATLGILSWRTAENNQIPVKPYSIHYQDDTSKPRKKYSQNRDYTVGDLDKASKELDRAAEELNKNMNIDFAKMDKELKAAMDEMKKIDFEKISREVQTALAKVDWEKTRTEVERSLREAEKKMKDIDKKQIEKEMAKAKEEMSEARLKSKIDMEKIRKDVEKGMAEAKVGIEKAKKEIAQLKEFTESLEKDGLIDRKKGYRIEVKKGELYINGTKQSKEVNDKYRKYFKEEDYSIRSDGDGISSL
ncbi:MAG: hypothetical protein IM584_09320 [Chitinophagaceae bacterium]|nr:hypothetical protein [Chitinophagaceae bacterium]MCA6452307.1 hypothetical protein [Chitinophagaceae bacterium]MCA6456318.1 hypothetical protein [Chitinophagaceae bacterium]MCA6460210.1 hypothetical protein [Chitinophagaceae bacterium]MCA6466031.1 hypothetical protein [Chitinophagaceae bacterium]